MTQTKVSRKQVIRNPLIQSVTSASTVTASWDTDDQVNITALAANVTLANPTGTANDGQMLFYRIKDNGTSRTIAVGTQFRAIGVTIPTATTISKTTVMLGKWNAADTKLDIIAVGTEA